MEEEFKNLYLYLPSNIKTGRLLIDEENKINILKKITEEENTKNILKLIYNDPSISEINLIRGIVYITEAVMYKNGLYIKIEQKNQMRGSGYDVATAELFLFKDKGLYCITSADHGNYTINGYNVDPMYNLIYEKVKSELGEKAKLIPLEMEYNKLVKEKNLNGFFKKNERESLRKELENVYNKFNNLIYSYLGKINDIIIDETKKTKTKVLK